MVDNAKMLGADRSRSDLGIVAPDGAASSRTAPIPLVSPEVAAVVEQVGVLVTVLEPLVGAMTSGKDGGGGGRATAIVAILALILGLGGLVVAVGHLAKGDNAMETRLDRIEERARWNRWVLTMQAQTIDPDAELPPHPDDDRPRQ